MRGGARKGTGGAMPGAGRKPLATPTERHVIRLTDAQWAEFKRQGGSLWLQGAMNLLLANRPDALVMLLLDALEKKHGREWLVELPGKINEKVEHG